MTWALTLEGRSDRGAVVMLIDDRREAEHIASAVRLKGIPVVVRPHLARGSTSNAGLASHPSTETASGRPLPNSGPAVA